MKGCWARLGGVRERGRERGSERAKVGEKRGVCGRGKSSYLVETVEEDPFWVRLNCLFPSSKNSKEGFQLLCLRLGMDQPAVVDFLKNNV